VIFCKYKRPLNISLDIESISHLGKSNQVPTISSEGSAIDLKPKCTNQWNFVNLLNKIWNIVMLWLTVRGIVMPTVGATLPFQSKLLYIRPRGALSTTGLTLNTLLRPPKICMWAESNALSSKSRLKRVSAWSFSISLVSYIHKNKSPTKSYLTSITSAASWISLNINGPNIFTIGSGINIARQRWIYENWTY
jgi:hypothetical protein